MTTASYAPGRSGTSASAPVVEMAFKGEQDLRSLRDVVDANAVKAGLSDTRAADFVLAVHETAANSVRHGGGFGRLRMWTTATELVCEVADSGRFGDPMAGCERPGPESQRGRGLWMANRLCDRVELHTDMTGSVVRLYLALS